MSSSIQRIGNRTYADNTSEGYVGFGTTVPMEFLHLYSLANSNTGILIESGTSNSAEIRFQTAATGTQAWSLGIRSNQSSLEIGSGTSNILSVLTNGNIGIGTRTPAHALDVYGNIRFTSNLMYQDTVVMMGGTFQTDVLPPSGATSGSYGSASNVPILHVNAKGILTSVASVPIQISSSQVLGLAPSATTDTTNASNITTGTLDPARLPLTGVASSTYGSASVVPILDIDITGRITGASNTSIVIPSTQVTGLAPSAIIDTTNANNITTGTLDSNILPVSGVLPGVYGSSNMIPGIELDAIGRVIQACNMNILIPSTAVTGLAPSATIDTTHADNIISGTISPARLPTTGVISGVYGSASSVPIIELDATGRITQASNTDILIPNTAVIGLAPSATIDTTNACNVTSGTFPTTVLPDTGVVSGTYGSLLKVPIVTIDSTGRVTTISESTLDTAQNVWSTSTDGSNIYVLGCNVGIGTTNPNSALQVHGSGFFRRLFITETTTVAPTPVGGSNFAPSATIDTTNATNITSGTLNPTLLADSGVVPGSYGSSTRVPIVVLDVKGRVTHAIDVPLLACNISGLAPSATIDTTNACNISSGTLSAELLPLTGVLSGSYGNPSNVPLISVDATGRISEITTTSIVISSTNIIGLAPSASIDTTNATNITSGTLSAAILPTTGVVSGSYGTSCNVPLVSIDETGRVTAISVQPLNVVLTTNTISGLAPLASTGNYSNVIDRPFVRNQSTFYTTSNIGIGVENPIASLHVGGDTRIDGTLITSNLIVLGSNTTIDSLTTQASNFIIFNSNGTGPALSVSQRTVAGNGALAAFYDLDVSASSPVVVIADTGRVGIGSSQPANALDVTGTISYTGDLLFGTTPVFTGSVLHVASLPVSGATSGIYGNASNIPVLMVDTRGRITSASNTPVYVSTANVLGLAPSATTDTTNASNITSGTLPAAQLPPTGVVSATYGSASNIPVFSVDATGRVTTAASVNINIGNPSQWTTSNQTIYITGSNVGIGTVVPSSALSVGEGGVSIGTVYSNIASPSNSLIVQGSVGVGTTNPTSAVTVTGDVVASGTVSSGTGLMFRNRIINGDMNLDQSNIGTGAGGLTGSYLTYNVQPSFFPSVDRWRVSSPYIGALTAKQVVLSSNDVATSGFGYAVEVGLVPKDGLGVYFPFNNSLTDASGNGYNLTIAAGSMQYVAGVIGDASLYLANEGSVLTNPTKAANRLTMSYAFTGSITVSLWACFTKMPFSSQFSVIFHMGIGNTEYFQILSLFNSTTVTSLYSWAGNATATTAVNLNTWYHIAAIWVPNTSLALYVNGVLIGTAVSTLSATSFTMTLGDSTSTGLIRPFAGFIDDFRIYNRVLTVGEIAALARNVGMSTAPLPTNWATHLTFDGTLNDVRGGLPAPTITGTNWSYYVPVSITGASGLNLTPNTAGGTATNFLTYTSTVAYNLPFSMSVWFNPSSVTATQVISCIGNTVGSTNWSFQIYINTNTRLYYDIALDSASYGSVFSSPTLQAGNWYHAVMTATSGGYMNGYINGILVASGKIAVGSLSTNLTGGSGAPTQLRVGCQTGTGLSYAYKGLVDDIRLYTRQLSTADAAGLYAASAFAAYSLFQQAIEGVNLYDLEWGTPGALPVTASAWIKNNTPFPQQLSISLNDAARMLTWITFENNSTADTLGFLNNTLNVGTNLITTTAGDFKVGSAALNVTPNNAAGVANSYVMYNMPYPLQMPFTISCWIKPSAVNATQVVYSMLSGSFFNQATTLLQMYLLNPGSLDFWMNINGTAYVIGFTNVLVASTWYHLCVTLVGNTLSLYRNGVLAATSTSIPNNFAINTLSSQTSSVLFLGTQNTANSTAYKGFIDDFRIYNSALTAAQVFQLYANNVNTTTTSLYLTPRSVVGNTAVIPANSWQQVRVTFPGDTGGFWEDTTDPFLLLSFALGSTALYSTSNVAISGSTSLAWNNVPDFTASNTQLYGSNAQNILADINHSLYITGVQLEKGTLATPYEFRNRNIEHLAANLFGGGNVGIGTTNPLAQLHVQGNMRVNGYMSVPNSVYVSAWCQTGTGDFRIAVGAVVTWNQVNVNIGGGLNTTTGIFTAPVTGIYYIHWTGLIDNTATNGGLRLQLNTTGTWTNVNGAVPWKEGSAVWSQVSMSVLLQLNAGNQIRIIPDTCRMFCGNTNGHNSFVVQLLTLI